MSWGGLGTQRLEEAPLGSGRGGRKAALSAGQAAAQATRRPHCRAHAWPTPDTRHPHCPVVCVVARTPSRVYRLARIGMHARPQTRGRAPALASWQPPKAHRNLGRTEESSIQTLARSRLRGEAAGASAPEQRPQRGRSVIAGPGCGPACPALPGRASPVFPLQSESAAKPTRRRSPGRARACRTVSGP